MQTEYCDDKRIGAAITTFAAVLVMIFVTACGGNESSASDTGNIIASDAWARPAIMLDGDATSHQDHEDDHDHDHASGDAMSGGTNHAVYLTIENTGDADDRLIAVESSLAGAIELHRVNVVDGIMQMRPADGGIRLPAGETVVLEPAGLHIMMIGINRDLKSGDSFEITLEFEEAGNQTIEVDVRDQP